MLTRESPQTCFSLQSPLHDHYTQYVLIASSKCLRLQFVPNESWQIVGAGLSSFTAL
jgi:hypothetical protein